MSVMCNGNCLVCSNYASLNTSILLPHGYLLGRQRKIVVSLLGFYHPPIKLQYSLFLLIFFWASPDIGAVEKNTHR